MHIKRGLCLSLYHFFLSLLVTCFSMYVVSRQLNGEFLLEGLSQALGVINIILLSPSYWLYEHLSGAYQWLLFTANSLVWGIALELLITKLHTRRKYFA